MIKRISTIIISCMLAFFLVEILTRLMFPMFDPTGNLVFENKSGFVQLEHKNSYRRQSKNSGDYNVSVYSNSFGFRDNDEPNGFNEDTIFAIGDSFTFGWGVEESQRFSDLLQKKLETQLIINVAMPTDIIGYQAIVKYLRDNDIEIKNSIIGICMENDIVNYYSDIKDKNDEIGNSFIHELKILGHKYSATYIFLTTAIHKSNILNKLFRKIGLINENLQYDPLPDQSAVNDSIRALKELRLLIKNDPLIIIIPSRDLWNKEKSKKAFAIHVSFLALLESNGFNYLDLREPLERNNDPLKYFFKNDPHWNSSGHELVAEEIFLYLQS